MPCTNWESIWLCVTGRENTQGRSVSLSQVKDQRQAGWGCLAALLPQIPREPPEGSVKPGPSLGLPAEAAVPAVTAALPAFGRRKGRRQAGKEHPDYLQGRFQTLPSTLLLTCHCLDFIVWPHLFAKETELQPWLQVALCVWNRQWGVCSLLKKRGGNNGV